jgi:hypothetical protein
MISLMMRSWPRGVSATDQDLVDTIRRVHNGQRCMPLEIASELTCKLTNSPRESSTF